MVEDINGYWRILTPWTKGCTKDTWRMLAVAFDTNLRKAVRKVKYVAPSTKKIEK
jgi:hypothetical protein